MTTKKFKISEGLKSYIEKKFPDLKNFKPNSPDDLVWYRNKDKKRYKILKTLCSDEDPNFESYNHKRMIKECLNLGVDINDGEETASPVIFSAIIHRPDLALFLLENGAYNEILKHFCAEHELNLSWNVVTFKTEKYMHEKIKSLNYLCKVGDFKPDWISSKGKNMLQSATSPQLAQWLLDKGLDPLKVSDNGKDAIEYHGSQGNHDIVAIYKNHIAQMEHQEISTTINQKEFPSINHQSHQTPQEITVLFKSKKVL